MWYRVSSGSGVERDLLSTFLPLLDRFAYWIGQVERARHLWLEMEHFHGKILCSINKVTTICDGWHMARLAFVTSVHIRD
jgi:hypothetical protein